MENKRDLDQESLVNELRLGRELARNLQAQLNLPSSSFETREMLVQKIVASYEKTLLMLNSSAATVAVGEPQHNVSDSPPSLSPKSEDSDREFRDQEIRDVSRKRKNMPKWTQRVRVNPEVGVEGPPDDGFNWRKYGQKDILGAKFPRGYYRCTLKNTRGCPATKLVQRTDDDPFVFEITYRGRHTCSQVVSNASSSQPSEQNVNTETQNQLRPQETHNHQQQEEILFNFRTGLKVITEDLDSRIEQPYPSMFLPSTSNIKPENQITGDFSPSFVSPGSASRTNYFSVPPSNMQDGMNLQNSDHFELSEIISAATSSTNSPTVGFDFPFGNVDFDPNFTFDGPGFPPR